MRSEREDRSGDPVEKARYQWDVAGYPDASAFATLVSLLRTYSLLVREIERILKPVGVTLSRFEVLLLLSFTRERRLPIMRLRDLLFVHGSSATYLVDRLVQAGMLEREADPDDRRVSIIHLTDRGAQTVEEGVAALANAGFAQVGALDEDQRQAVIALLRDLRTVSDVGERPDGREQNQAPSHRARHVG